MHTIYHPNTSYSKYRCQYKTNPLLNRLHNDSGYPEEFLKTPIVKPHKNYLSENKKGLKNFFSDRIPHERKTFYQLNETIDPVKIF